MTDIRLRGRTNPPRNPSIVFMRSPRRREASLGALLLLLLARHGRSFPLSRTSSSQQQARHAGAPSENRLHFARSAAANSCSQSRQAGSRLDAYYYGRGAEIWPPPIDGDRPLDLADSFPHGVVPPEASAASTETSGGGDAAAATTSATDSIDPSSPETWTRASVMNSITRRILRRAAARDENNGNGPSLQQSTFQTFLCNVPKVPGIMAVILLAFRWVSFADLLGVTIVSGYVALLSMASHMKRPDGVTPACPGLPPQGHVPLLVRVPLTPATVQSREFAAWCRLAALLGLVQPAAAALHHLGSASALGYAAPSASSVAAARLLLRPVFWACCQLVTERACRRTFPALPLPIRILIPVLYNTIRIPLLCECAVAPCWGAVGRTFAVLNLAFWSANLFGFLLPVAVMRYLRAHFFMVEAEQVTLRPGMEDTIGLPL